LKSCWRGTSRSWSRSRHAPRHRRGTERCRSARRQNTAPSGPHSAISTAVWPSAICRRVSTPLRASREAAGQAPLLAACRDAWAAAENRLGSGADRQR
jgi:hypothetical protein